jgi:hypothetical protein
LIACQHARPGHSFSSIYSSSLPTCKTWWHPFCHCGVGARQASTGDPQSFAGTRIQPSTVGSDHHRVMHAPDASSTCHPLCDCVSAIHCFSSAPCSRQKKISSTVSPKCRGKPAPKGPEKELVDAVVEMKGRNPTWGCPRYCGADYVSLRPRDQ